MLSLPLKGMEVLVRVSLSLALANAYVWECMVLDCFLRLRAKSIAYRLATGLGCKPACTLTHIYLATQKVVILKPSFFIVCA